MKTYKYSYDDTLNEHLQKYFKEIDNCSPLSKEEEFELIVKAKSGDLKSRDKLLNSNLKFVVWIATKYQDVNIPFSDLIQEGNIGLMTAVDKFDIERGLMFKTYAFSWVKQAILGHKANYGRTIRLPFHQTDLKRRIDKAVIELTTKNHREPTIREIAKYLKEPFSAIDNCLHVHFDMMYIDTENGNDVYTGNEDNMYNGPGYDLVSNDRKSIIHKILNELPEIEQNILNMSFGLINGGYEESLSSIGQKLGFTEEKVRSVRMRALKRFREYAQDNNLNEYLNL